MGFCGSCSEVCAPKSRIRSRAPGDVPLGYVCVEAQPSAYASARLFDWTYQVVVNPGKAGPLPAALAGVEGVPGGVVGAILVRVRAVAGDDLPLVAVRPRKPADRLAQARARIVGRQLVLGDRVVEEDVVVRLTPE